MITIDGIALKAGHAGRSSRRAGSGGPKPAAAALDELVQALGIAGTLRRYDVVTLWSSIVGEQVAKVTTPERIENGVLFVRVSTAPWRAELSMRKAEIIGRIDTSVGKGIIHDIRFH